MTEISTSNINRLWCDLVVEELIRSGVTLFCLAPGSRSTPLVTAVAANDRAEHVMHFDERGTAFYALGYARATRRPAVWITTSGTAVANGLPAVVEASADGVPMLLLTADRPPELRDTGANQTIDQVKIFGDYPRWAFDLPVPSTEIDPRMVLTTVDQAVYRARRAPGGPVHLNAMFREPLAPEDDGRSYSEYIRPLEDWSKGSRPHTAYGHPEALPDDAEIQNLWSALTNQRRGLVVAGRLDSGAQADSVRWLAERLGWPLLPDASSQLRLSPASPNSVPHYDLMLSSEEFAEKHRPEAVLVFGSRPTSKRLAQFLAKAQPEPLVVVRENPSRLDPHHRVTHHFEADVIKFCERLAVTDGAAVEASDWLKSWTSASARAEGAMVNALPEALSEPVCARLITSLAPEDSGIVAGSSMPIRDIDLFGAASGNAPRVTANRGASGIDGSVATAAGFAHGLRRPVTLLTGDLALLHDLNSLALLRNGAAPVIVVVVNNHGGGIFSFLPIARHEDVFEPYFGTPHELSFKAAAEMFGLAYRHVSTQGDLTEAYSNAIRGERSAILEVTTDREENVKLHRRLERAVAEAVG